VRAVPRSSLIPPRHAAWAPRGTGPWRLALGEMPFRALWRPLKLKAPLPLHRKPSTVLQLYLATAKLILATAFYFGVWGSGGRARR
jgi:hypothetical protein